MHKPFTKRSSWILLPVFPVKNKLSKLARRAVESTYRSVLSAWRHLGPLRTEDPFLQLTRGYRHRDHATIIARVVSSPIRPEPKRVTESSALLTLLRRRYLRLGISGANARIDLGHRSIDARADEDGFILMNTRVDPQHEPTMNLDGQEPRPIPFVGPHPHEIGRAHV